MHTISYHRYGERDFSRNAIIFDHLSIALSHLSRLRGAAFTVVDEPMANFKDVLSGVSVLKTDATDVAAGLNAFVNMHNCDKVCVLGEMRLHDFVGRESPGDVIKRAVWSAINTKRILSLDLVSWSDVQLMPARQHLYRPCPPLRTASSVAAADARPRILIINHQVDIGAADELIALLGEEGIEITTTDAALASLGRSALVSFGKASAYLHIHVGFHDEHVSNHRLLDSWASGAAVCQLMPKTKIEDLNESGGLTVDEGGNGLWADTIPKTVANAKAVIEDPRLRGVLVRGGEYTLRPFRQAWNKLAEELLADA